MPLRLPAPGVILLETLIAGLLTKALQIITAMTSHQAAGLFITVWLCLCGMSAGAHLGRYPAQTASLAFLAGVLGAGVSSVLETLSR